MNIFRFISRKCRRLLVACLFTMATVLIFIKLGPEVQIYRDLYTGSNFVQIKDPFNSRRSRYCAELAQTTERKLVLAKVASSLEASGTDQPVCYTSKEDSADVRMEDVLDTVSVGYPNLILTVTGWVETIKVKAWSIKPLTVIIMPHSHQDPGWLHTVDSYFSGSTRNTVTLIVEKLTENPSLKFIWSEVGLLQRWWTGATNKQKERLNRLVEKGQLELVSGGWVMTDESVVHYGAILDQLIEGQVWIKNNINASIENSWAIDPFGHSTTMAYLLKQSGIRNMVIQRTHFAIKRMFASQKGFDFQWRQTWDDKGSTDIFCHMMPFMLYGIPFSCGPDRHVCCKFDFHKKQCFYGKKRAELVRVTDDNVAELSKELWQQLQKKSELFRSNVVLMPHGDDFRYKSPDEWENQFGNLQKIMKYINSHPEMKMTIEFGTLKDFFRHLNGNSSLPAISFPVLSGDFFPYSDRGEQYWSGFYTSRPYFKYLVRQLQQLLRSAEILFTFSLSNLDINTNMTDLYRRLETARRTLALSQHHDAITGTSRKTVMQDYTYRVLSALHDASFVQTRSLSTVIWKKKHRNILINLTESFTSSGSFPSKVTCSLDTPVNLIVWNDLGQARHDLIHVIVDKLDVIVTDASSKPTRHQISPVWSKFRHVNTGQYLLSIEANVEAFSLTTFTVSTVSASPESVFAAVLNITSKKMRSSLHKEGRFEVHDVYKKTHLSVSNLYLTAEFKTCDGMLASIFYNEQDFTLKADTHFVTYSTGKHTHPFQDKSGAYIFLPDGVAKDVVETPQVLVVEGRLFTDVRAVYHNFTHVSRIYNISGILAKTVQIENYVDISSTHWDNMELAIRIETSVDNANVFYTDSNGFQINRRKTRSKMTIQGNIYPMTTVAILESADTRFTLLSSESHGVASLVSGWLEIVLDRRLVQDDWRGLNEGLTNNVLTKSTFYLLFEKKLFRKKAQKNKYASFHTLSSDFLSNNLNSPLKVYSFKAPPASLTNAFVIHMGPSFPCGLHFVNLRMLDVRRAKEALVIFHSVGIDCSFSLEDFACQGKETLRWSDMDLDLQSIRETSLTGTKDIREYQITNSINIESMQIKTYKIAFR